MLNYVKMILNVFKHMLRAMFDANIRTAIHVE